MRSPAIRITDPLLFYQTVNNDVGARLRLSSIVNASIRDVIAASNLEAVVRRARDSGHALNTLSDCSVPRCGPTSV